MQPACDEHAFEHVQVADHRGDRHAEGAREVGRVEQVAMHVDEHLDQRSQTRRRQANPERGEVAFEHHGGTT